MAKLRLMIASPERELYHGDVDMVLAPGFDGQLGILPSHSPLIAQLGEGLLCARVGAEEYFFAIHGGFMQVLPDRVIVLADTAERAEEIDLQRAEEARQRALQTLRKAPPDQQRLSEVALRRSQVRLRAGRRRRRRAEPTSPAGPGIDQ
jgi:F-type H+-transporting ATPase subunit epsilon